MIGRNGESHARRYLTMKILLRVFILATFIFVCGCGHRISIRQGNEINFNSMERTVIEIPTVYMMFELRYYGQEK